MTERFDFEGNSFHDLYVYTEEPGNKFLLKLIELDNDADINGEKTGNNIDDEYPIIFNDGERAEYGTSLFWSYLAFSFCKTYLNLS